jgi:hypothetical protein
MGPIATPVKIAVLDDYHNVALQMADCTGLWVIDAKRAIRASL